jgi:hypothetical protein
MSQQRQYFRIEGEAVHLVSETIQRTVKLSELLAEAGKETGVTTPILPQGCRFYHSTGQRTVFDIEQVPQVRQIVWTGMEDGERWKLAFPFVVFVVVLQGNSVSTEECRVYYRTQPLAGTDDPVSRPNLCNTYEDCHICTGSVRVVGNTLAQKAESFVTEFWKSTFNSDLRDCNFYPAAQKFPQVATLTKWQEESQFNPLFLLAVKWLDAGKLQDAVERRY